MINTNALFLSGIQLGKILTLTTVWLLVITCASYADYKPQGGDPHDGGSTTSGMRI